MMLTSRSAILILLIIGVLGISYIAPLTATWRLPIWFGTAKAAETTTPSPKSNIYHKDVVSVDGVNITLNGRVIIPRGVEIDAVWAPPSFRTKGDLVRYDHFINSHEQMFENAANNWKAYMIRFPISQIGLDPQNPAYSKEYLDEIKNAVSLARQQGFIVIASVNDQHTSGSLVQHKMPTEATQRALLTLTRLFNDDLGVIYETFNEPELWPSFENWKLWLNGGNNPDGGDQLVGMQSLVDEIRRTGSQNVIIVEGLFWGRSFFSAPEISDPLNKLVYGVHPYYADNYISKVDWDKHFGFLVKQGKPVLVTEWCAATGPPASKYPVPGIKTSDQMTAEAHSFLDYLESRHIGMCLFAIDFHGTIVTDTDGIQPTTYDGFTLDIPGGGPGILVKNWFNHLSMSDSKSSQ